MTRFGADWLLFVDLFRDKETNKHSLMPCSGFDALQWQTKVFKTGTSGFPP